MAIPVIDPETSVQSHRVGEMVYFQMNATNSPMFWYASGLPPGLSISLGTGVISGIPEYPGAYDVRVFAEQAGHVERSAELLVVFGIEIADYTHDDSVDVDIDISNGKVTFPGGTDGLGFGKLGDTIVLMVGFKKYGTLLDLPIALLRVGFKEFDDGNTLWLSGGDFTKVGAYESTRYRMVATIDRDAFTGVVSGYAEDKKTILDAIAEFEWMQNNLDPALLPAILRRSSQGFTFNVGKDLVSDSVAP
jgi:hypothetical protein